MAMEVRGTDRCRGDSAPLQVLVDGLTLSPEPEPEPENGQNPQLQRTDLGVQVWSQFEEINGELGETARAVDRKPGFTVQELYRLAVTFCKEKQGKAFHPTYEEKLRLVALQKQVSLGPFDPSVCPDVGFFDVLGSDRRKEWASLGNMAKHEAMLNFVKLLNKCCHLFAPYVTSHTIEREEQEKRRQEEERRRLQEEERERRRLEEERLKREEEKRLKREEEEKRHAEEERLCMEQQKQQIMAALNAQTAVHFQHYAAQQYPSSAEQQQLLICQLQEKHYQQYMQQLYQMQLAQQQDALLKQQELTAELEIRDTRLSAAGDGLALNGQPGTPIGSPDKEAEPETTEELTENSTRASILPPVIATPSMWMRPQIKDFKEKIRQDADSVITVGRGEVVTVRVPTHQKGSHIFWEFATDHYDIGFGVNFEWMGSTDVAVSRHVSESSEDEGEDQGEMAQTSTCEAQVYEIVPVSRRDCHEEVYAGSHQYPSRGVYLLKFDNSYSLWRSKSVYYRVYYTR